MYVATPVYKKNLDEAGRFEPVSFKSSQPIRHNASKTVGEFNREACKAMKVAIGPRKYGESPHGVTFNRYAPADEASLQEAINAAYRQVLGNKGATSNQRLDSDEAKLRNGEISVRGFVKAIAKSLIYKDMYFHAVSPQRGIELNLKHLLGRPPINKAEVSKFIAMLASQGFDSVIDYITDSAEYTELFGCNTVPYARTFISMGGMTTSSFNLMFDLGAKFASSDNALSKKSMVYSRLIGYQAAKTSYSGYQAAKTSYSSPAGSQGAVRFRAFGCK